MSWRLETADTDDTRNRVVIQPVAVDNPREGVTYVAISVAPRGDEQAPTLQMLLPGLFYRDRTGLIYTILEATQVEDGDEDGSVWRYEYLAALGKHDLSRVKS